MGVRPEPAQQVPGPATIAGPVTQARVVRAEWTKLRELRSTRWSGLSTVVLIIGLGALLAVSGTPYKLGPGNSAAVGVSAALLGIFLAQLVIGVVGVLSFSGEYGTGIPAVQRRGALWGSPLNVAHPLSPWTGFACLCGYAVVLVGLAAWQLRRRDA